MCVSYTIRPNDGRPMRILASNPDTLGDFVLRQPLYAALRRAGHELTLIVRPSVAPLVAYVAPGASVLLLPHEVYGHDVASQWEHFGDFFAAARELNPDALLISPFNRTLFDERLVGELPPGVRLFGMRGALYAGDPYAGAAPRSALPHERFDVLADVREDQPEVEKNAALAAAIVGTPPATTDPMLEADESRRGAAREVLHRLGLEPGGYWAACVTGTVHVPIKAW